MHALTSHPVISFDRAAFGAARLAKGLSIEALARKAGISVAWTSQINRGVVPSLETRRRVAHALGVAASSLWKEER